jgi:hypothetical protein
MAPFVTRISSLENAVPSAAVPTDRHRPELDPIPAAMYLRMSTEHQQYSMENQSRLIEQYSTTHGFSVAQTYTDAAKSGVLLKNRNGLRQLLKDVMGGNLTYKASRFYDISRWGASRILTNLPTTNSSANPLAFRSITALRPSPMTALCPV